MKLTLYANDKNHLGEMANYFIENHEKFNFLTRLDSYPMTNDEFPHLPWREGHHEINPKDPNRYQFRTHIIL